MTEPVDLPVPVRHLDMYRAHIACSDIVWAARGIGGTQARDAIAMSAIEHGTTPEGLAEHPTLISVTNVNSPRRVDEEILDNIMIMAAHGQCVCITPFTLMGAMAPVTLAGALVQQTAEALGIITLVQMIRPGCPAVLGGFTSNVDMRTGSPAFGTPEYVHATLGGAQIARALKLPYRSSAVCASPAADAQATYETGFSLGRASWDTPISSCTPRVGSRAASPPPSRRSSSTRRCCGPGPTSSSRRAHGCRSRRRRHQGHRARRPLFRGRRIRSTRYQTAFWRPILSDWSEFRELAERGGKDATQRAHEVWKKTLEGYEAPPLDPAVREAIDDYVARRRIEIGA